MDLPEVEHLNILITVFNLFLLPFPNHCYLNETF